MVKIYYVSQDDNGYSIPNQLDIDDDGYFIDEWPEGFFDERMKEL